MVRSQIKIFISYAREDLGMAKRLYSDLKQTGVIPWLDTEDLLPGQNWELAIKQAIKDSSYVLALLSFNSVSKNGFLQEELKIALDLLDHSSASDIFIIPVRLDNCRPVTEMLQHLHWVELFPSYNTGLNKILNVLLPKNESNDALKEQSLLRNVDLHFFEGAWFDRQSHDTTYARVINGKLFETYCFEEKLWQQGHRFDIQLKKEVLYYRFEWLSALYSGCGFHRVESQNELSGGWWLGTSLPSEVMSDITKITDSYDGMRKYVIERVTTYKLPYFAEQYFERQTLTPIPTFTQLDSKEKS